ncbi:DUF4236 domain-containing protein [Clostridium botulinum]|uniref:DUF4236 domain-containing protein n=1 Tax=Clostridium botulinum TaxID=1491 RepID=A0A6M0SIQ0_CLOBO|nr:DUF4236 domain-containing protein [Clostridium botulinum]MCS6132628.1 DUF4236 domain-containing protein [Clostridium botulinum]NFA41011.1 DUF4236 domain-containing protein [Clostridium botulinum]NFL46550.1 DUF4236 domain-containing protein [Clostridium botulinum]NFL89199.1 DUF4236 domain-containing protein [Clostridium botulinum]
MGFRFRKSKSFGPFKVNLSKKGVGWSVGTKGVRYTKRADGKKQTTLSIPGTGISYVDVKGSSKKNTRTKNINNYSNNSESCFSKNNKPQMPFYKKTWFMWLALFLFPPLGITLLWFFNNYNKKLKISLSIFFGIIFIMALSTPNDNTNLANSKSSTTVDSQAVVDKTSQESKIEPAKLIGWQNVNGKYYFYDDLGNKQTGWLQKDSKYYFLNSIGIMQTGWVNDHDKYYYCSENGAMQTGWIEDKGKWYYLNTDGTMAKDISKDGYTLSSSGVATKEVYTDQSITETESTNTYSKNKYSVGTTTSESASNERTVYWTPGGKSYHYNRGCSTLSRSKNILSGTGSQCPKTDPCDKCTH